MPLDAASFRLTASATGYSSGLPADLNLHVSSLGRQDGPSLLIPLNV